VRQGRAAMVHRKRHHAIRRLCVEMRACRGSEQEKRS
jgi:hypothetical protein